MKVSVNEIGMILHGFYMSDYFNSENIEESIEQLIADKRSVVSVVPESNKMVKRLEAKGYKVKFFDLNNTTSVPLLDLQEEKDTDTMKTKIYKIDFGYMALIQAENELAALELYRNTVGYVETTEEQDFISNLTEISTNKAIDEMKEFAAGPEELEQLGKEISIKLIDKDCNQVLLMEYP